MFSQPCDRLHTTLCLINKTEEEACFRISIYDIIISLIYQLNENSVIIYSTSCCSVLVYLFCRGQMKAFWRMLSSFVFYRKKRKPYGFGTTEFSYGPFKRNSKSILWECILLISIISDLLRRNLNQLKLSFQYHSVDLVKSFALDY